MNPKVSVIVPVYGAEAFLPTCISSLRAQTLRDLLGCAALAASGGGAGVLVTTSGVSAGWPEWFVVAAYGLLIVAFLVIAALLVAGLADQHFGWVREHALAGVHA